LGANFLADAFVVRLPDAFFTPFEAAERPEELAALRPLPAADFAFPAGRLRAALLAPRDVPAVARLPPVLRPVPRPAFRFAIPMPLCLP
jgi:hypothetical protein